MKYTKTITHKYVSPDDSYADRYSISWDEGQSWARLSGPEFQITVSKYAIPQLKELVRCLEEHDHDD